MLPYARHQLQNKIKRNTINNKHMKLIYNTLIALSLTTIILFASCRGDNHIVNPENKPVVHPDTTANEIIGFYLLNQGNMGSNKASLDYFDYKTGIYSKNIYAERNPNVVQELGDVGNDLQIYGNQLYAVINCSNLVEVMDVNTAKHIGVVSVPNCRYITFDDGYAYVSSYAGPVKIDPNARLGYIAKIDTTTLQIVDTCNVGYQPEEMVIIDNKLYVANSGGYMVPNYDNTISVVDLSSFEEIEKIEVAINLHHMQLDQYGNIWVSSRGDYYDTPSRTYVVSSTTHEIIKMLELPNSNMTIAGDSVYICSNEYNYNTGIPTTTYAIVNTQTQELITKNCVSDSIIEKIVVPYCIEVNPITKELFLSDAKNYVTPGKLYCYDDEADTLKWSVTTGDVPSNIAFVYKK